jgi:hypothetical protein
MLARACRTDCRTGGDGRASIPWSANRGTRRKGRPRLRKLRDEFARVHPHIQNPEEVILQGAILVGGRILRNPLVACA